jgi:hypothetical protein
MREIVVSDAQQPLTPPNKASNSSGAATGTATAAGATIADAATWLGSTAAATHF